jgi:ATP-dependent DNA helicase UvrD/PcrA
MPKKYRLTKIDKTVNHQPIFDESRFEIDYQNELNPAQYDAVSSVDGAFLVIAGAGTGKTRTLVYRVARLVELGIDPQSILLLTFTRKASREMMNRAAILLDNRCSKINGGTFHSFANLILRKYSKLVGIDS